MKGRIILQQKEKESQMFDYGIFLQLPPYDYEITINTDFEESFQSIIKNIYKLDESLDFLMSLIDDEKELAFYKNAKENKLSLLINATYITFVTDPEKAYQYLEQNPILKSKKIVFVDYLDLDLDFIAKIEKIFKNNLKNIYFDLKGNTNLITYLEYAKTTYIINDIAREIEQFSLSPLEKIMYAYDIVRSRIYNSESNDENKELSRNLTSSLLGEKIVCLGYVKIFKTILKKIGIESREVYLESEDKTKGHARIEIYIQDKKYNINGVYYFDPTWDSKKNKEDKNYLLSYKYFAMTKQQMELLDRGKYTDLQFPYYSEDMSLELSTLLNNSDFSDIPNEIVTSLNHMSLLITKNRLINRIGLPEIDKELFKPNKEEILKKIKYIEKYFQRPISEEALILSLYNIRKNQYYLDPDKYPFSIKDIYITVINSRWMLSKNKNNLLNLTQGEQILYQYNQCNTYLENTNLKREIERIKLAKILRKVYEKRISK